MNTGFLEYTNFSLVGLLTPYILVLLIPLIIFYFVMFKFIKNSILIKRIFSKFNVSYSLTKIWYLYNSLIWLMMFTAIFYASFQIVSAILNSIITSQIIAAEFETFAENIRYLIQWDNFSFTFNIVLWSCLGFIAVNILIFQFIRFRILYTKNINLESAYDTLLAQVNEIKNLRDASKLKKVTANFVYHRTKRGWQKMAFLGRIGVLNNKESYYNITNFIDSLLSFMVFTNKQSYELLTYEFLYFSLVESQYIP